MTTSAQITTEEIMVFAASNEFSDHEVALVGTGLPMIAAYLAKITHAPNTALVFESGVMDASPTHMASGVGDFPLVHRAIKTSSLFDSLSLLQRGKIDLGFLGAAEIDEYGNINSTVIGPYLSPKVRLPGSGGANDIASLAGRVVIIAKHQLRKFPKRVNYLTTPGFIDGPGSRESYGLRGAGPVKVITDLCIMGFDDETKRMKLLSLHPGVTLDQVKENTGFELMIDKDLTETELPSQGVLKLIRSLDPDRIYIGKE
jgi:acyl CoA:acetate/3-ketoacid CoA transferase beta subunit